MKITRIEISELQVPLITPFKTALRTVDSVLDIIVTIHTDTKHTGYGEAPPTAVITGDTLASIQGAIEHIGKQLIGRSIDEFNELIHTVQHAIVKNSSAKAALEIALYDLYAQNLGKPLYKILGGNQTHLTTDLTISVDHQEKMLADVQEALDRGFTELKVKVGKSIKEDIDTIIKIYKLAGPEIAIRLDANQAWTVKESLHAIRAIEDAGIVLDLVEQPVAANDIQGMVEITSKVLSPILADETIFTPLDAIKVIQERAADIINIKLMKTGGISNALKILAIADLYNIPCMIGCMLEASVSVTAAAHLAAAYPRQITRIDLDGPSLCSENPVSGGIRMDGPNIDIDNKPGLGIDKIVGLKLLQVIQ